jgi:hypothetical protein
MIVPRHGKKVSVNDPMSKRCTRSMSMIIPRMKMKSRQEQTDDHQGGYEAPAEWERFRL